MVVEKTNTPDYSMTRMHEEREHHCRSPPLTAAAAAVVRTQALSEDRWHRYRC